MYDSYFYFLFDLQSPWMIKIRCKTYLSKLSVLSYTFTIITTNAHDEHELFSEKNRSQFNVVRILVLKGIVSCVLNWQPSTLYPLPRITSLTPET